MGRHFSNHFWAKFLWLLGAIRTACAAAVDIAGVAALLLASLAAAFRFVHAKLVQGAKPVIYGLCNVVLSDYRFI